MSISNERSGKVDLPVTNSRTKRAFELPSVSHAVHADGPHLSFLDAGSIGKVGLLGPEEGHNNVPLPDTHANHGDLQDSSSRMTWATRRRPAMGYEDVPIDLALPVCAAVVAYGLVLAEPGYRASAGPLAIAFNDLFHTVSVPTLLATVTGIPLLLILPGYVVTATSLPDRSRGPNSPTRGDLSSSPVERLALSGGLSLVLAAVVGFVIARTPMEYEPGSLPYSVVIQEATANHGADGLEILDDNELTRTSFDVEGAASVERGIAVIRR